MDSEAYFESIFGFRDYLDDTDMRSHMDAENLSGDEARELLAGWIKMKRVKTVEYWDGSTNRRIYFTANAGPHFPLPE